ncbi:MAG TPA: hypothetical protein DCY59_14005 [Micrococcaceae bacterium]|nr:hypothetical protein [Micrococcaceae bacterium]
MECSTYDGVVKKILPLLLVLGLSLSACARPSLADFRQQDPDGNTACIHFGGAIAATGEQGRTNLGKAAEHGAAATTEAIRQAVSVDESGSPQISDQQAFTKACEKQGFEFK